MESSDDEITVTVRLTCTEKHDIKVKPSMTILEAKQIAEPYFNIPPAQQRFIHKGHILKDNEKLSTYNVTSGHIIHLVKGRSAETTQDNSSNPSTTTQGNSGTPANSNTTPNTTTTNTTTTTAPTSGFNGRSTLESTLGDALGDLRNGIPGGLNSGLLRFLASSYPGAQGTFDESTTNPSGLGNSATPDDRVSDFLNQNPLIPDIFGNPETLRALFNGNPNLFDGDNGNTNREGSGNQELTNFIQSILRNPAFFRMAENNFGGVGNNPNFERSLFDLLTDVFVQNRPNNRVNNMVNNTTNNTGSETNPINLDRFQPQLQQLKDMGFLDQDANATALHICDGDLNAAITWLLDRSG